MRPGDPSDPLLRQVLPLAAEDNPLAGFTTDPVGELGRPTVDGVLYKYHGRALVVVLHANHANEIDGDVRRALAALAATGATLLNQSVLLGGVNDEVDAMADLSESLFAAGVLPYYLHMLDPVDGAAHFRVSDERARELVSALAARLPGYLVPRLVREVGGAPAKVGVDLWG
jgi:L-lysine 2,3-aminomutase